MDFEEKYKDQTSGILHGFDRILFSGHLSSFFPSKGMYYYLSQTGVRLVGYEAFMITINYLNSPKISKDQIAKVALSKHPTKKGLIAILSCQETAYSFKLLKNGLSKELEIVKQLRKHLHYYCYYMDAEFGWMFVKIQSWYPFTMHVYVNGREHLKRSLDKTNITYTAYDNSLTSVSDIVKAQQLADKLVQKKWDRFLNTFAQKLNPHLSQIQKVYQGRTYHWSLHQCEYASDVLFKERNKLEALYQPLVQYATYFKGGQDIYTFFGRNLHANSTKEVTGNTKRFSLLKYIKLSKETVNKPRLGCRWAKPYQICIVMPKSLKVRILNILIVYQQLIHQSN